MDRKILEYHFALAMEHVAKGEQLIDYQRRLTALLEQHGHNTTTAKKLLALFEAIQEMHVADHARVAGELSLVTTSNGHPRRPERQGKGRPKARAARKR